MVVDTSASMAVLLGEPDRDQFIDELADAHDPLISAATLVESSIVILARAVRPPRQGPRHGRSQLRRLLRIRLGEDVRPAAALQGDGFRPDRHHTRAELTNCPLGRPGIPARARQAARERRGAKSWE